MTDLTDADLDSLYESLRKVQGPTARINKRDKTAFAAGLAAGRARALQDATVICASYHGEWDVAETIADAIRALK